MCLCMEWCGTYVGIRCPYSRIGVSCMYGLHKSESIDLLMRFLYARVVSFALVVRCCLVCLYLRRGQEANAHRPRGSLLPAVSHYIIASRSSTRHTRIPCTEARPSVRPSNALSPFCSSQLPLSVCPLLLPLPASPLPQLPRLHRLHLFPLQLFRPLKVPQPLP